jgi:hypothetical protein
MYPPTQKISHTISAKVTERTTSFSGAGSANILTEMQYPSTATSTKSKSDTSPRSGFTPKMVDVNERSKKNARTMRKGIWWLTGKLIAT